VTLEAVNPVVCGAIAESPRPELLDRDLSSPNPARGP
jgi:hypothetical protein